MATATRLRAPAVPARAAAKRPALLRWKLLLRRRYQMLKTWNTEEERAPASQEILLHRGKHRADGPVERQSGGETRGQK